MKIRLASGRPWLRRTGIAVLALVVQAVATVMKNVPRKEVATEIDISGRLDNPKTSTFQAIVKLIQNAFIKAILPGFDREVRQQSGGSE